MPEKIYTSPYPTVPLVSTSIYSFLFSNNQHRSAGNEAAYIDADTGKSLSRNETKRLTLEFAWGAQNQLTKLGGPRLGRGSTVLIFSPNSIAYPILLFGGLAAGFKCTLANSGYTHTELAYQYRDSGAEAVFVHPALVSTVMDMFAHLKVSLEEAKKRIIISSYGLSGKAGSGFVTTEELLGKGTLDEEERFDGKLSDETALICYSSGTTGNPKGVEVSRTDHRVLQQYLIS
jgi:4-coumarate--CoA ligase